jgi:hypothetical protein
MYSMRGPSIRLPALLIAGLLAGALAGCVKQSTSYYISDSSHALTLRADQQYLWQNTLELTLIAARMPDCQRQFALGEAALDEVAVELYAAGENVYSLRTGGRAWQIDTTTCTQAAAPPANALGQPLGSFLINEEGKLVFEPVAR